MLFWFLSGLKYSFVFAGRASRKEYWSVLGGYLIGYLCLVALGRVPIHAVSHLASLASYVFVIFSFFPNTSVTVRRLHDMGVSGWWVFPYYPKFVLGLIPVALYFASHGLIDAAFFGLMMGYRLMLLTGIISLVTSVIFIVAGVVKSGGANKYGAAARVRPSVSAGDFSEPLST